MKRYIVTLKDGTMKIGPWTSQVLDTCSVLALDKEDAANKARAEKPGKPVVRVEQVFEFHITLRGHEDKRRRETFIMRSTSERDAIVYLDRRYPQAWRFARYSGHKEFKNRSAEPKSLVRSAIVKIEKKEATS